MIKKLKMIILSIIGCLIFLNNRTNLKVKADSELAGIKIGNNTYCLPMTFYVCHYCWEDSEIYIAEEQDYFKMRQGVVYQKHVIPIETVTNEEELTDVMFYFRNTYDFSWDEDAIATHGEDALPNTIIISSYNKNLFEFDSILNGSTVSELYLNYEDILDVYVINSDFDYGHYQFVEFKAPVLDGESRTIITDYDNLITVDQIQNSLTAIDEEDGDISDKITIFKDEYSQKVTNLGNYSIIFEVLDSSNNRSELEIIVKVVDITSPVIDGPNVLNATTESPISLEDIKDNFTLSDNYDDEETLKNNFIVEELYTSNPTMPGDYNATLKLKDSSNNETIKNITIKVKDDTKPIISGSSSYTKSCSNKLLISQIMSNLTAFDNFDGDLTNLITLSDNNYLDNAYKAGTYNCTFIVKDSSNNISDEFIVTITNIDENLPVFYVNELLLHTTSANQLTNEEIIDYIYKLTSYDLEEVEILNNEYSNNYDKAGEYVINAKVKDTKGIEKEIKVKINVDNYSQKIENKTQIQKLTFRMKVNNFFVKFKSFISSIFNNIAKWLNKIL